MADLNLCVFIGRLGRDPEVRYTPSGDAVCNISLAVGKKWKDKNSGEMKEQTTWVNLAFWGKPAELLGQYAHKGSQMRVNGEYSVRKWQDKDGKDVYTTEIKVQDFQLLGGKPEGAQGGQQSAPAQQKPAPQQRPAAGGGVDDDIPF
jgi:single-strand DNA-binding protein